MNISIIIPTYNRGDFIGPTIKSLLKQEYTGGVYEIIIVDNRSTDRTKDVVQKLIEENSTADIRYYFEEKQGLHYGRNTGARIAKHELIYYTDDDVEAPPNMLQELVRPFHFDSRVACVTGRVLPRWQVQPPAWILKHCNNHLLSLLDSPDDFVITKDLPYVYGCHQAVLRKVVLELEGSHPELVKSKAVGDGESGLNRKIRDRGYKFGFNGDCITFHVIPSSRMTQSYLNKRIGRSGPVNAYTQYRLRRPSNWQWTQYLLKTCFVRGPLHVASFGIKAILNGDIHLTRFSIAYIYFYTNFFFYGFRLLYSTPWKKFVLKNDWLSNDKEFYDLLTQ